MRSHLILAAIALFALPGRRSAPQAGPPALALVLAAGGQRRRRGRRG